MKKVLPVALVGSISAFPPAAHPLPSPCSLPSCSCLCSSIDSSVLLSNMHGALWIGESGQPVSLTNNVVFEAYDKSAIKVTSTGNTIKVGGRE
eukprot:scaffold295722_cov18-Tisochrysis_lutea.AAC.3